jgi:hypothetical protein
MEGRVVKLYVANFAWAGMVVAIAPDIYEALDLMRDQHPDAALIKIERVHEAIVEHEITDGLVIANLGDA